MTTGDSSRSAPGHKPGDHRVCLVCLALALLTFAVFSRTLGNGFVNLDDPDYITENASVTNGLSFHGIAAAFAQGSPANWDPLTTISHMADCQIFGLHPGGHHLTNLLLHTASVVLLFLVLQQATGVLWPSAFAAALFAVHPLRVESVAWVTERKDVLSGFFFVLTLGAYLRYVRRPGGGSYLVVMLAFALGLMSKAMLLTLPVILLLLDFWPLDRFKQPGASKRLLLEKLPLGVMSLLAGVAGFLAQGSAVQSLETMPLPSRLGNALDSYVIYLRQLVWPANLAPYYPFPQSLPAWKPVLSLAILIALTAAVIGFKRKRPFLLTGWLWYLVMLLPVIGLVQLGWQARADRYTYLPQIGLCIALAWLISAWLERRAIPRTTVSCAAAVMLASLSAVTLIQTGYWHDSISLWERTLACTPPNAFAEYNYGMALIKEQRLADGRTHLERAANIRPNYVNALHNLGTVCLQMGDPDRAVAELQKVLTLQPDDAMTHYNLGVAYLNKGQAHEAVSSFQRALQLQPNNASTEVELGAVFLQLGQLDEAVSHLERARQLQPDLPTVHAQLARAAWFLATHPDSSRRDGPRAVRLAQEALQNTPAPNVGLLLALAAAHAEAGQFDQATIFAEQARQLSGSDNNPAGNRLLDDCVKLFQSGKPYRDPTLTNGPAAR